MASKSLTDISLDDRVQRTRAHSIYAFSTPPRFRAETYGVCCTQGFRYIGTIILREEVEFTLPGRTIIIGRLVSAYQVYIIIIAPNFSIVHVGLKIPSVVELGDSNTLEYTYTNNVQSIIILGSHGFSLLEFPPFSSEVTFSCALNRLLRITLRDHSIEALLLLPFPILKYTLPFAFHLSLHFSRPAGIYFFPTGRSADSAVSSGRVLSPFRCLRLLQPKLPGIWSRKIQSG